MDQEKNIKNINKKITNFILNINPKYIKKFLNIDYCNKELIILKNKITNELTENDIILFNTYIKTDKSNLLTDTSKYYIKLMHIFATIFNITSNNFNIINNTLHIPFDISNCIPEIQYIYETKYDYKNEKFTLNNDDKKYKEDLKYFSSFFLDKKNINNYFEININNITENVLNKKKNDI